MQSFNGISIPNIKGDWQIENASTAIKALQCLNIELDLIKTSQALQSIELNGRLQYVSYQPDVILDVSHNQEAAASLSKWLEKNPIQGKTITVFSVLDDKNFKKWAKDFKHVVDVWCVSEIDSSRAMPCSEMIKVLANHSKLIISNENLNDSFNTAIKISKDIDRIIVFGSFYTVSEIYVKNFEKLAK